MNPDRLRNYEKFPLYLLFILGGQCFPDGSGERK